MSRSKPVLLLAAALATVLVGAGLIQVLAPSDGGTDAGPRAEDTAAPAASTARKPRTKTFTIATFNVLGHSHARRLKRSMTDRTKMASRYLDKHGVSVVGLQELETPQYRTFARVSGGDWYVVGAPSRSGKSIDTRNAIAFRTSRFKMIAHTAMAIPYFYGKPVNMPIVRLQARGGGKPFWVINTHNPADARGPAQKYRDEATRRQVALANKLRSRGDTVFVTGDMNEKQEYFCPMTRSGAMKAASGGSRGLPCKPPRNGIDWIFGSADVRFSGYVSDASPRQAGVSDHAIVAVKATMAR